MKNNVLKLLITIMAIIFTLSANTVFAENTENQEKNIINNSDIKMSGQSKGVDYSNYVNKEPSAYLNPTLIGVSSFFVPGAGQAINQEYGKGAGMLSLYVAINYEKSELTKKKGYNGSVQRNGEDLITYRTKTMQTFFTLRTFELELRFYSAFDAFRDARRINEAHGVTYYQPVSSESTTELWLAPFNYENFLDPFVALPLLYLLYDTESLRKYDPYKHPEDQKKKDHENYISPTNSRDYNYMMQTETTSKLAVGVGEETFFRGYLYPASAELTQSHFWGGALESAIFGLAHGGAGVQANSLEAFLMGSYFTYISYSHDFALGPSIALHSWWDTIISLSLIKQNKGKTKFDKKGNPIKQTYNLMNIGFTF